LYQIGMKPSLAHRRHPGSFVLAEHAINLYAVVVIVVVCLVLLVAILGGCVTSVGAEHSKQRRLQRKRQREQKERLIAAAAAAAENSGESRTMSLEEFPSIQKVPVVAGASQPPPMIPRNTPRSVPRLPLESMGDVIHSSHSNMGGASARNLTPRGRTPRERIQRDLVEENGPHSSPSNSNEMSCVIFNSPRQGPSLDVTEDYSLPIETD